uniref:Peptidase A1 domain-containing protein n=1 Tax=Gongylonema pulchrum TaxID=637853 RepID=A0A183D964_9BILA
LAYLSAVQTLADFAQLVPFLKTDVNELGSLNCPSDTKIPVIAFGAPMLQFPGTGIPPYSLDAITTRTFVDSGCSRDAFSEGFVAIYNMSQTGSTLSFVG